LFLASSSLKLRYPKKHTMKDKIFTIIYLLNPIGLAAQVPGVKVPQFPQPASISPGVVIGLPNPSPPSTGLPFGRQKAVEFEKSRFFE
jgi:hypothetical protein